MDTESRFSGIEIDDESPAPPKAKPSWLQTHAATPAPVAPPSPASTLPAPVSTFDQIVAGGPRPVNRHEAITANVPAAFQAPPNFNPVTPNGVPMSLRMARCYGALHKWGAPLTPFSTDSSVKAYAPKIAALMQSVTDIGRTFPVGSMERELLRNLWADLSSVALRTPANRSQPQQAAQVAQGTLPGVSTQPPALKSAGFVAVSVADETTGAVTYWQLSGDVFIDKLRAAWLAEGLLETWLPAIASEDVALRRAAKELQEKDVLIRKHPEGGWAVVRERAARTASGGNVEKSTTLAYEVVARITIGSDGGVCVQSDDLQWMEEHAGTVHESFRRALGHLSTQDVSVWLVRLARQLHGVALRSTGGIYFVPKQSVETLRKIKRALKAATAHDVHEIPAMKSAEAFAAILDALSREASEEIADVEAELNADIGTRKARNRMESLDVLSTKIRQYETLIGKPLNADVKAKIKTLREKLAAVTTRTGNLEID